MSGLLTYGPEELKGIHERSNHYPDICDDEQRVITLDEFRSGCEVRLWLRCASPSL